MQTFIIPTSTTEFLAKKIKNKSQNIGIIFPDKNKNGQRYFSDGEVYIKIAKIKKLKNGRTIILHSGAPKPNEGLVELELILQILKDNKIKPEIFFTYFPYGLQDKIFEKGEINAAENLIKKLVNYYNARKIYIIDPHFQNRPWAKKYPIVNISAVPLLIEKLKKDFKEDILFLSPDKGGKRRTGISGMEKKRLNSYKVKMLSPDINLKGKTVAVIDDLIQGGATLIEFHKIAKKLGAKKIIALVTHGVLLKGVSRVKKKFSKLYLTNTINQKEANIDITNLIIKTLIKI